MKIWCLPLGFAVLTALLCSAGEAAGDRVPARPGASVPWTTCQAEQASTNGQLLGPDYTQNTPAREASGRQCVRLSATGQFIQWTAPCNARGLVIRYSIPDSADGTGADATLSLYINGQQRNKLGMTSRYSHLYGEYPFDNHPASGSPRNFWDELRIMPGNIHAGDRIRLQKDPDDQASQYFIDLMDFELVGPPLEKPSDALSVGDFGATPDDQSDDRGAFLNAISAAKAGHRSVWIPPGRFIIGGPIKLSDVALRGAGTWYSTLVGVDDYTPNHRVAISGDGSHVTLSDFAIVGKLNYRNDSEPNDGIGGSFGTGSIIRNIWVEHTKTGAWIVNSKGLLVEGCRFRDTLADGINLCVGVRDSIVRDCTARGNGDDCFAMWPAVYMKSTYSHGGNRFVHCTAEVPFLAQAFSIYGGDGNAVEQCRAIDIPYGAGLLASTTFPTEFGFRGTTRFSEIEINRAGASQGAIGVVADRIDLDGLRFNRIQVLDSPTDGIKFMSMNGHAIHDVRFDRVCIVHTGVAGEGYGIVEAKGALGSASLAHVCVTDPATAGWRDDAPGFRLIQGQGNDGIDQRHQSHADRAVVEMVSPGG